MLPWKDEIVGWDDLTFLDKAGITAQGQITRAALLLVGRSEATHFLSPYPAQLTWNLEGEEAYEHFGPPFILTTTFLLNRVRNVTHKLFPANQLLAVEIQTYETRTILEGLHNCIAHQDYERCERVLITETTDRLIFENAGCFFDGAPDNYLAGKQTPRTYRNPWLAKAMHKVGMIDQMGYGIHNMTKSQRGRYLPLPGYKGSTARNTKLEILGRPIDVNYTQLLLQRQDLELETVILLDRVQKKLPITDEAVSRLRREGLIEGRKPNYYVSAVIAAASGTEAIYTQAKVIADEHLKVLLIKHLQNFPNGITRPDVNLFIIPLIAKALNSKQQHDKITNLLAALRRSGAIRSLGKGPGAKWFIV